MTGNFVVFPDFILASYCINSAIQLASLYLKNYVHFLNHVIITQVREKYCIVILST